MHNFHSGQRRERGKREGGGNTEGGRGGGMEGGREGGELAALSLHINEVNNYNGWFT